MKRLPLLLLALFAFLQCKKENRDPMPGIASIVGKWRIVENRQTLGDSIVTEAVPKVNSYVYEFRFDGVLLNSSGYVPCCLPSHYFLNGKAFVPAPATPVELDPICAYSLCAACPEMKLTQTSPDSLAIETCAGSARVFIREK